MGEEELRKRAKEGLDAMENPFIGPRLAEEMLEGYYEKRKYESHLTLHEIWKEISSIRE